MKYVPILPIKASRKLKTNKQPNKTKQQKTPSCTKDKINCLGFFLLFVSIKKTQLPTILNSPEDVSWRLPALYSPRPGVVPPVRFLHETTRLPSFLGLGQPPTVVVQPLVVRSVTGLDAGGLRAATCFHRNLFR